MSQTTRWLSLPVLVALLSAAPVRGVAIPDKNLETALRGVLRDVKGEFTDKDLNNVFVLEADGKRLPTCPAWKSARTSPSSSCRRTRSPTCRR